MIRYNPYCPALSGEKKKFDLTKKHDRELAKKIKEKAGNSISNEFPVLNTDVLFNNRNIDICMICNRGTTNLKSHFADHVLNKEVKRDEYYNYYCWSRAKKAQLVMHPTATYEQISQLVNNGNIDGVVDMMVERGITVINEKADLRKRCKFSMGDHIVRMPVPTKNKKWRIPAIQQDDDEDGKITKEYAATWTAWAKIELKVPEESEGFFEPKDLDIARGIVAKAKDGSLTQKLKDGCLIRALFPFIMQKSPAKFYPAIYGPNFAQRKQIKEIVFPQISETQLDPNFFRTYDPMPIKRKMPLTCDFPEAIEIFPMDIMSEGEEWTKEELQVYTFYAAFCVAVMGMQQPQPDFDQKPLVKCVKLVARTIRNAILSSSDMAVKDFYANKAEHMEDLNKGRPRGIYSNDLFILANTFNINIIFSLEAAKLTSNIMARIPGGLPGPHNGYNPDIDESRFMMNEAIQSKRYLNLDETKVEDWLPSLCFTMDRSIDTKNSIHIIRF